MPAGSVLLNEILPAPKELYNTEWVELYNPGPEPIDLSGWSIDDEADGGAQRIAEGSRIGPGELLLIELSRAILNNSGDTVRLLGPDGGLVDSFSYTDAAPDLSFSRSGAGWNSGGPPSPGEPNPNGPEPAAEAAGAPTAGVAPIDGQQISDSMEPAEPALAVATAPGWQVAAGLRAGAITPAATYAAGRPGRPYERGATCLTEQCTPTPPPTVAPERAALPVAPAAQADAPIWPSIGGMGLIGAAIGLLVVERTRRVEEITEVDEEGVL